MTGWADSDLCEIRRETLAKFCPIKTSCVAESEVEHEGMITGANSKDADISRSKFEFIAPDDTRDDGEEAVEGGALGSFNQRKTNTDKTRYHGIIFVIK